MDKESWDETIPATACPHGNAVAERPIAGEPRLRDKEFAEIIAPSPTASLATDINEHPDAGARVSKPEYKPDEASPRFGGGLNEQKPSTSSSVGASPQNYISVDDCGNSYPEGGFRAWLVVYGSFSGMTASFGLMNTIGTFQAYLSTHQLAHLDPSTTGWIFSLYNFLSIFCGVQIGPIFDSKGPRALVAAGTVCLVGGMFGAAESTGRFVGLILVEAFCPFSSFSRAFG